MDIAALGYEIDSSQARSAAKDLDLMAARAQLAERVALRLSSAANGSIGGIGAMGAAASDAGAGANSMASNLTNVSFQVQDFAVQVASGQEAITAFAQQFPQLTSSLGFGGKAGLYGAVIGTAAAVGVALYQALTDTTAASKQFKEQMDALEESVSSFRSAAELAASPLDKLYEKFGTASPVLQQALVDLANIEKIKAYDAINATAQSMAAMVGYVGQWNAAANEANQYFLGFTTNSEAARIAAFNFHQEMLQLSTASDPLQKLQAAINLRDQLDAATGGYKNMNAEQRAMREGLSNMIVQLQTMTGGAIQVGKEAVRINTEFRTMDDLINSATSAASSLSGAVAGIAGAAQRAGNSIATMAQRLWDAAQAKATFNGVDAGGLAAQYAMYGQGRVTGERLGRESGALYGGNSVLDSGGRGGSGGGGAAQKAENELERLQIALQKDSQFQIEKYERDYEVLKNSLEKGLLTKTQYKELEAALNQSYWGSEFEKQQLQREMEQQALEDALEKKYITQEQYNQRIMELQNQEREITLGHYDALFGNMATIAKAGGDKATAAVKAFSIAQGLINSYLAYTQVLADPSLIGRPFLRTALAASTLAAGLAQVANMGGGGGGAGRAGGTTSATSATASEPNRVTRVELVGDDWLVKLAESMMTQIYDASRDGRVIVARG